MTDSKYFTWIVVVCVAAALLLTAALMGAGYNHTVSSDAEEPEYASKVFDKGKVTEINIEIDEDDFEWLMENARQEEYRSCDVTLNGTTFYNVGLRPKGNSSLSRVIQDDTTDRFSFKLEFDTFIEGQSCFGLSKLALNNMISDNSYMKEYLAYNMFETMDVVTPKYAYTNITINGEPWGLYLAVECMEEDFVERNYGSLEGNLYKPEGSGADLVWKGDGASNYSGIKNNAAYDVTDSDFQKVIDMIENLNAGTNLEKYLDIDAVLRYFAVNTFLINFDNYTGNMNHNYYLYEEDGICTILPWDFNLAFGGFGSSSAEEAINYPVDTPVQGELSEYPLIGKLLEVEEYKELYHKYLNELVETYVESGLYEDTINNLNALIGNYVKNDPTAFCTYEEYKASLPVLLKFGELRSQSIVNQLAGTQSSIAQEKGEASADTQKVSAEGIDLKALGNMGGGGPGENGGKAGNTQANAPANGNAQKGNAQTAGNLEQGGAGSPGNFKRTGKDGPPGGGDMPDQETMTKVRDIIGAADGEELTDEQVAELKELGLDNEQIERMKNMPAGIQGPGEGKAGGEPDGGAGAGDMKRRSQGINLVEICYAAAGAVAILLGLLYVYKTKKRKFSS